MGTHTLCTHPLTRQTIVTKMSKTKIMQEQLKERSDKFHAKENQKLSQENTNTILKGAIGGEFGEVIGQNQTEANLEGTPEQITSFIKNLSHGDNQNTNIFENAKDVKAKTVVGGGSYSYTVKFK